MDVLGDDEVDNDVISTDVDVDDVAVIVVDVVYGSLQHRVLNSAKAAGLHESKRGLPPTPLATRNMFGPQAVAVQTSRRSI